MAAPLVAAGVSKSFDHVGQPVQALRDVTFEIPAGGVTGLIGADGSGKTTFMRLAAALLLPDEGTLSVLGFDTREELQAVQSGVGYMPQHFGLYEDLTVQENLDLYAAVQGVEGHERSARYHELMEMTGLAPFTGRLAGRLSGGMKQKLGLACALVRTPRLLLLDEPTVGVDPVSRRELWRIIYRQVEASGMTVLLSTAYLDEAERCQDVVLLHEGRVLDQGPPAGFSQSLNGRTWIVGQEGVTKRGMESRLSSVPGVLDAVVSGDGVRVVGEQADSGAIPRKLESMGLTVSSVPARFEDAFVARLAATGAGRKGFASLNVPTNRDADNQTVIEVREARRMFGDFCAVRDVTFSVQRGEVFGLLGANGAGKTTLFRMLCGLLPLSAGRATVAGVDLRQARARARSHIGYMAQKFSLYSDLSVSQNLEFFASAYGLWGHQKRERVEWALASLDLEPVASARAHALPLGYQQRLALAAALMHEPEILFLDEPTSGVDPLARRGFWRQINALVESGVTVLVTTHFLEEAEYCDRLVILAEGEILAEGTPPEIKAAAQLPGSASPGLEEAFIALIERHERVRAA
jgi:ABC-2 type transport system ATP-binding protein